MRLATATVISTEQGSFQVDQAASYDLAERLDSRPDFEQHIAVKNAAGLGSGCNAAVQPGAQTF